VEVPEDAIVKFRGDPALAGHLEALRGRYAALPTFTKDVLEAELRAVATERGVKAGALIHPTRAALSGAQVGPPLFDLVEVMGQAASVRHLDHLVERLRAAPPAAVAGSGPGAAPPPPPPEQG
jgi:glutamyl/glutaminyl-tRNA synthetase